MNSPCKGCEYRHIHCHAECDEYKEFVMEREKVRRERLVQSQVNNARMYVIEKRTQDNYRRRKK